MYTAMRWVGTLSAAGLLVSIPGCFGSFGDSRLADASTWKVPIWEVGDYWLFEGPDGNTERRTVAGIERMNSQDAYQLDLLITDRGFGTVSGKDWVAVDNLASLGSESRYYKIDENCGSVFPLENRTFSCVIRANGSDYVGSRRFIVEPPERITTPAGKFWTVPYTTVDLEGNLTLHNWYSDEVGYLVQYEIQQGPFMKLVEWSYDPKVGH